MTPLFFSRSQKISVSLNSTESCSKPNTIPIRIILFPLVWSLFSSSINEFVRFKVCWAVVVVVVVLFYPLSCCSLLLFDRSILIGLCFRLLATLDGHKSNKYPVTGEHAAENGFEQTELLEWSDRRGWPLLWKWSRIVSTIVQFRFVWFGFGNWTGRTEFGSEFVEVTFESQHQCGGGTGRFDS